MTEKALLPSGIRYHLMAPIQNKPYCINPSANQDQSNEVVEDIRVKKQSIQ